MDHVKLRLNACPHSPCVAPAKAGGFVQNLDVVFYLGSRGNDKLLKQLSKSFPTILTSKYALEWAYYLQNLNFLHLNLSVFDPKIHPSQLPLCQDAFLGFSWFPQLKVPRLRVVNLYFHPLLT